MTSDVMKILLVEDDADYAALMQTILHYSDVLTLEVTWAGSLKEAIALLSQQSFNAMLLDLSLPDSNGADTFHRAREAAPHLPIILLTSNDDEEIGLEAVRYGIQDYLIKGRADGHQVIRAIRYAIERKQMEDSLQELRADLEVRVLERTNELALANDALKVEMAERIRAESKQLTAVMEERARIAREIHDTIAQGLTGIVIQLETAEYCIADDPATTLLWIQKACKLARDTLTEARNSVWALRPHTLEDSNLVTAISKMIERLSQDVSVAIDFSRLGILTPLPSGMEHDLQRLCQEAITNALKHANARWIHVALLFTPEEIELSVQDDGQGFDPAQPRRSNSFGLYIMEERVAHMDGKLTITSGTGQGTCIIIRVPVDSERLEIYYDD